MAAKKKIDEPVVSPGIKTKPVNGSIKPLPKTQIAKPKTTEANALKPTAKKSAKKTTARKQVKPTPKTILTVEFRIRFHTKYGQSLYLIGDHQALGNGSIETAVPMEYLNTEAWKVMVNLPGDFKTIKYSYLLKNADGSLHFDWGAKAITPDLFKGNDILIIDSWNHPGYYENVFYTEPFQNVLLPQASYVPKKAKFTAFTHRLSVKAPLLSKGFAICLLGNMQQWSTETPLLMSKKPGDQAWTIDLNVAEGTALEYKYGVYDLQSKKFVSFETGKNRHINLTEHYKQVYVNDGFVVLPNDTWKGTGLAIPVFSLRTERSFGIGEFTDLKLLVDWVKQLGLKMIQILPVNDTSATNTWKDSYPYAAISAFALHPIYLDIEKVLETKNTGIIKQLNDKRKKLNANDSVDYSAVIKEKWDLVNKIYNIQKESTFQKPAFRDFFKTNEHWLVPYATFCSLKDEYSTADFTKWPANNTYVPSKGKQNGTLKDDKLGIYYFVQYHLHLQLKEASAYAHANGIILKGDIPIGIYRHGVDAWQRPELYHMEHQAGAPPDDFAVKGQNWGFPTYNWPKMMEDRFTWWRQRFQQMSYYFDAFRIDHILGFFRIWSIPLHAVEGIMGRFVPAIPVDRSEFDRKEIPFDKDRYCQPFITDDFLDQLFGNKSKEVKQKYLDTNDKGSYTLKEAFNTQKKVEEYFSAAPNDEIKQGLYDLISNIILFEEEGSNGRHFHIRFSMQDTYSFKSLDNHIQKKLNDLYVDYFFKRQDDFWEKEALQKLPELKRSTNMLICGEDLGLVPHCVPEVMSELGILSLEIQRMPKATNQQFFRPVAAPYLSVVTPSTHDMSTIRGWWEEDRQLTQKFYNEELGQTGEAPIQCEPWVNREIVLQHLYSPAMWAIFQLQDLLGMDQKLRREDHSVERINVPANPQHYWNYRMHIPIEQLLRENEFNLRLKEYIRASGRNN